MSRRRASRLAWSLWLLWLALGVGSGAFEILNRSTPTEEADVGSGFDVVFLLLFLSFATVGALVASRRPGNPIGWIFCVLGLSGPLVGVSGGYALYALGTRPGSLPGGEAMAWLVGWLNGPSMIALLALVLLIFPTGRPLSPRWRPVAWASLLALVLVFLWTFAPGPIDSIVVQDVRNPFGIEGAETLLEALGVIGFALMLAATVAGAVSLIVRFRRALGEERQQLKWFAFAGGLFCVAFVAGPVIWSIPSLEGSPLWPALFVIGVGSFPIAAGIAILKYRLYEIDVIIRRTLVYGLLTASLAGTYFGIVLLLQFAFNPLTEDSALAIAGSTLAVAALFRPGRRRIQEAVDRRFYRTKYDAARTLEAFSARLREEIDLDALRAELTGVVRETMQPAHVSLWLRR